MSTYYVVEWESLKLRYLHIPFIRVKQSAYLILIKSTKSV